MMVRWAMAPAPCVMLARARGRRRSSRCASARTRSIDPTSTSISSLLIVDAAYRSSRCVSATCLCERERRDAARTSLPERLVYAQVLADLKQYRTTLESELVELINKDYADFVNLSANLAGIDKVSHNLAYQCERARYTILTCVHADDRGLAPTAAAAPQRGRKRTRRCRTGSLATRAGDCSRTSCGDRSIDCSGSFTHGSLIGGTNSARRSSRRSNGSTC